MKDKIVDETSDALIDLIAQGAIDKHVSIMGSGAADLLHQIQDRDDDLGIGFTGPRLGQWINWWHGKPLSRLNQEITESSQAKRVCCLFKNERKYRKKDGIYIGCKIEKKMEKLNVYRYNSNQCMGSGGLYVFS